MQKPHTARLAVVATLVGSLALVAFAWPAVNTAPNAVPIAIAGPQAAADTVAARLDAAQPGSFEVRSVADRTAAEEALADREVYGAVLPGQPATVLVASAASPAVAQVLAGVASGLGAETVDVAPLPDDDQRGSGIAAGLLPLLISSVFLAALATMRLPALRDRLVLLALGAPALALALTGLLQGWLGVIEGDYLANAGVLALGILAASSALTGLHSLLGRPGFLAGSATLMLLGSPLSAATSAPEMLPDGWAALGQALPPGATVHALRGTSFFDGAGTGAPVAVLLTWTVLGLLLAAAGAARSSRAGTPQRAPRLVSAAR